MFAGWVDSPNGLGGVNAVIPGTPLSVNSHQIQFNLGVQGGENGFDWQQQESLRDLQPAHQRRPGPGLIDIGAYAQHPYSFAPFQLCAAGAPPPPEPAEEVVTPQGPEMDPDAFQPVLSAYGQWVDVAPYGMIWKPNPDVVGPDFVPYGNRRPLDVDRRRLDLGLGLSVGLGDVPLRQLDCVDGPGPGCPARLGAGVGQLAVRRRARGLGPIGYGGAEIVFPGYHYCYVDSAHFGEPNFWEYRVRPERIEFAERQTRVMEGGTRYVNGRPVVTANAGPPRAEIERAAGHPIRPTPMAEVAKQHPVMPPANAKGVHYAKAPAPRTPSSPRRSRRRLILRQEPPEAGACVPRSTRRAPRQEAVDPAAERAPARPAKRSGPREVRSTRRRPSPVTPPRRPRLRSRSPRSCRRPR